MSTRRGEAATSNLIPRTSGLEPSALWTLFTLTLRQFLRGKRAIVLIVLALLPAGLVLLLRLAADRPPTQSGASFPSLESSLGFFFLFQLVPHVMLPLTALLYGSGMILDEEEEQTLTYLLIRSLPKWALYVTKLAAVICMVAGLGFIFVVVTFLACYAGAPEFFEAFPGSLFATILISVLALTAYSSVFALLSMWTKRVMILGIVYAVLIELVMANLDFAVRRLTVMYYFRCLSLNLVSLRSDLTRSWSIDDAPSSFACIVILLGASLLATILGVSIFSRREFHVKTPEGS